MQRVKKGLVQQHTSSFYLTVTHIIHQFLATCWEPQLHLTTTRFGFPYPYYARKTKRRPNRVFNLINGWESFITPHVYEYDECNGDFWSCGISITNFIFPSEKRSSAPQTQYPSSSQWPIFCIWKLTAGAASPANS
jgi:hypothetical protein